MRETPGFGMPRTVSVARRRGMIERMVHVALASLVFVAMAPASTWAAPTAAGPSGDTFYIPPKPLPPGSAGTPIWFRSSTFSTDPLFGSPDATVTAWQILYRSTSATGLPVAVSGTVLIPSASDTGHSSPIVAYGTGTVGIDDSCAISRALEDGTYYEVATVKAILDAGFVVVATDYEGLGTPGDHPYLVNISLGHALLDSLRAVLQIPELGLDKESRLGVMGYSEGGGAAAAAAELCSSYAPELDIEAVVAGGVPADPRRIAALSDGQVVFAAVFLATIGFDAAYPELALDSYLNDVGRSTVASARSECIASVGPLLIGHRMSEYTTTNPLVAVPYVDRFEVNRLGKLAPRMPVYLYHGENDEMIPIEVARSLRDEYCSLGASVTWIEYPVSEHFLTSTLVYPDAIAWLSDRFHGKRLPSTSCPVRADAGTDAGRTTAQEGMGSPVAAPADGDSAAGAGGVGGAPSIGMVDTQNGIATSSSMPPVGSVTTSSGGVVMGAAEMAPQGVPSPRVEGSGSGCSVVNADGKTEVRVWAALAFLTALGRRRRAQSRR